MSTVNSGLTCTPTYQEVKQKVTIECPRTSSDSRTGGYTTTFAGEEYEYIETVYNEVNHTLLNGTTREKWDNSNDPRFQQYNTTNGQPIFENYCRADKGQDEGYFWNLWEFPTTHTSEKEILVKYEPVYETADGTPTSDPLLATSESLLANSGACVRKVKITNNFALDKIDMTVSGLPEDKESSFIYWAATDTPALVFRYAADTRTVVKVGDVINGHTVIAVANFIETRADRKQVHRVIGDKILKINNTDNVSVGDTVRGFGATTLPEGTTISAVDYTNNTITLNLPTIGLNGTNLNRIRNIVISDAEPNQVPDVNYCYAEFGASSETEKNIAFRVEGPGIHYMKWSTTTNTSGGFLGNSSKIDNEGGNQVFDSGSTRTKTVNFDGGSLVLKADPVLDGNEYDSKWWIDSWTGTLPELGSSFQATLDGGRGKVKVFFKVVAENATPSVSGGNFAKNATYTASLSGANIVAIAGYGIIDRAALVGIIISARKDISYEPIFNLNQPILDDSIKNIRSNFPGIAEITDIRNSEVVPETFQGTCDPFLRPDVEIPTDSNKPYEKVTFKSDINNDLSAAIQDKIDELSGIKSISDIITEVELIGTDETELSEEANKTNEQIKSNLLNLNASPTSDLGGVNISIQQDTATTNLINSILNKFNEVPDDLNDILPEGVDSTIKTIDGQNESNTLLVKNAYRDLPCPQDDIEFFADDVSLDDDKSFRDYGKNSLRETINISVLPRWLYGTPVVGAETAGDTEILISGTALGGTSPANDLYILVRDVNDSTGAVLSNGFEVYGASVPKMSYPNSSGTLTTTATRASFDVTGSAGSYTAVVNTNAANYVAGQQIRILGTSLGGATPANDCYIQISSVNASGEITGVNALGVSANSSTFTGLSQTVVAAEFTVGIEWSDTQSITDDVYTVMIKDDSTAGEGYHPGDVITVQGSILGGTNTTHDLQISITEVDVSGGIVDYTFSGTPETLYTGVSGTNVDGVSGTGATFDILKGENGSGSPFYIVSLNQGGSLYNTAIVAPTGPTVDVVDAVQGILEVNGADLSQFASNFTVSFSTTAPAPLSTGTVYNAAKLTNTRFFLYTTQTFNTTTKSGMRPAPLVTRIRLSQSLSGITGVTFGSFGVAQTVNYYPGTSYVDTIDVSGQGLVYPTKTWKGADYEYRASTVKEYEFDLVKTSENIANSSFNKGNPIQLVPVTSKMTQDLNPADTVIYVEDTSKFLSSGYLMIPKWIRKTERYLEIGSAESGVKNDRNHYYYDGEEIVYYSGKTSNSFTGVKRSQFDTTYLFETSLEPFTKNAGMVNSYQKGYSVQQYWEYRKNPII